jgi:glycosyltransferase involved in cell wall biosynthesis
MFNALAVTEKPILSLIMPVYNDGALVIPTIATLAFTIKYPLDLIIVYDSESDSTVPIVKEAQKLFPGIQLIQNEQRRGLVEAVKTGFKNAKAPYVGIWICYQLDPFGVVNQMIEKMLEGYGFVTVSRFIYEGRFSRGSFIKKKLSKLANKLLRYFAGIPLTDATYTMKIYRKEFLDSTPITTDASGRWALSLELSLKALVKGLKCCEIPLERKNMNLLHGISHFSVKRQLSEYIRWFVYGFRNRKIIKENLKNRGSGL